MLTGKLPFEADTLVSVAIKQIQSQPTPAALNQPRHPGRAEEIVMRAMQKDADKRYQSAAEMLHDIDEFKKRNPAIVFFPTSTSSRRRYTSKTSCGISGQNNRQVENNSR